MSPHMARVPTTKAGTEPNASSRNDCLKLNCHMFNSHAVRCLVVRGEYTRLGLPQCGASAAVPKIKRALLYEMGIALVRLQWQVSLLDFTEQVKANKQ